MNGMNGSSSRPPLPLVGATLLGLAGVAGTYFVGGPAGEARFWVNWIFWFVFLLTIGLGALFIVAIEHLVSAKWSTPIRRVAERVAGLILIAAPAGVVALLSLKTLYPWAWTDHNPLLTHPSQAPKAAWLNVPFFAARVIVCTGLWFLAYRIFVIGSVRQDETRDPRQNVR